jgi:hypothetical protein
VRWRCVTLALATTLAGCGENVDVRLELPPASPASKSAQIRVSGLKSGHQVTVQARWRDVDGRLWTGSRPVRAGADGRAKVGVDMLAFCAPVSRACRGCCRCWGATGST